MVDKKLTKNNIGQISETNDHGKNAADPDPNENQHEARTERIINIEQSAPHAIGIQKTTDKKKRDRYDWIMLWLVVSATIFAAAAAGFTWWKGDTAKQSLIHAKRTTTLQNRAHVYFENVRLRPYPADSPNIIGLEFDIANSGVTPARKIFMRKDCLYLPPGQDPWASDQWNSLDAQRVPIVGLKRPIKLQGCNIPLSRIDETRSGDIHTFFVAEVQYEDVFEPGNRYVTQATMRLFFDKDGGYSFGFVGPHNCTDKDCP